MPLGGGGFKSQSINQDANKPKRITSSTLKKKEEVNYLESNQSSFMRRPKTLVCYICGREYGTKSLAIHLKTCEQKWIIEQDLKPKKDRKPVPQPPNGLINLLQKDNITNKDLENYNNNAFDQYNYENLEQCIICGRTFKPESLIIHQKSCKPGNPLKPLSKLQVQQNQEQGQNVNLNLVNCQKCNRNFASDRIQKHQQVCKGETISKKAIKAQQELERKQQFYEKYDKIHKPKESNWRAKHQELVESLQYMRKLTSHQQKGGQLKDMPPPPKSQVQETYVQCPYCSRKYNSEVAQRHIPKCVNIINKPKPPPQLRNQEYQYIPQKKVKSELEYKKEVASSLQQQKISQQLNNPLKKEQKINYSKYY